MKPRAVSEQGRKGSQEKTEESSLLYPFPVQKQKKEAEIPQESIIVLKSSFYDS